MTTFLFEAVQLSQEATQTSSVTFWLPSGIAVLAVVIGSILTGVFANHLQKKQRSEQRQQEALYKLQEESSQLRARWSIRLGVIESSQTAILADDPFPDLEQALAVGTLMVVLERVQREEVRDAFKLWKSYAQLYFGNSDEHSGRAEEGLWETANTIAGRSIRDLG